MKANRVNGRRTHRTCGECGRYIYENENDEWCANPWCEEFEQFRSLDHELYEYDEEYGEWDEWY